MKTRKALLILKIETQKTSVQLSKEMGVSLATFNRYIRAENPVNPRFSSIMALLTKNNISLRRFNEWREK